MKSFASSTLGRDVPRVPGFAEEYLPHTVLHPDQFRDIWNGEGFSPERELAAAVLDGAASDLLKYRFARRRRRQRLYWQAYQWIMSEDREWPFSFVNICECLRLSPEALRERLLSPPDHEAHVAEAA
jgi:hypothetical protein